MLPEPECNAGCVSEGSPQIGCLAHGIKCDVAWCALHGQHTEHRPACGCNPGECDDAGSKGCYFGEAPVVVDRLHGDGRSRRFADCAERNPEEHDYHPSCCRFPKSCSPYPYPEAPVAEDQLEPRRPAPEVRQSPRPVDAKDVEARLTKALHETETTGGWWGHPECEEFARIIAPVVLDMLTVRDHELEDRLAEVETAHGSALIDIAEMQETIEHSVEDTRSFADGLDAAADLLRDLRETFDEHDRASILSGETAVRLLARAIRVSSVVKP